MKVTELRTWKKVALNDLEYLSQELKTLLVPTAVLILSGEVGSGKTTLTKTFIPEDFSAMGSPSYSILHEYGSILHGDFYRLKNSNEIYGLELPLYLDGKSLIILEWAKPFLHEIVQEIGLFVQYYELTIVETENKQFRNYTLIQLDVN